MKTLLLGLLTIVAVRCVESYKTTDAKAKMAKHQTLAILPFDVNFEIAKIDSNVIRPKEIAAMRLELSIVLQGHFYKWIKYISKKFAITVHIQQVDSTNELLSSKNVRFADIYSGSKSNLAKVTNTDAVLATKVTFLRPAEIIFSGFGLRPFRGMRMDVSLYEKTSDTLLWQLKEEQSNLFDHALTVFSQTEVYPIPKNDKEELLFPMFAYIDKMMKGFAKQFPYQKNP